MLKFKGIVGQELRPNYFYQAFGRSVTNNRILSFGSCNFSCPYCKRLDTFRQEDGSVIDAVPVTMQDIFTLCDDAVSKGQVVRLSGGDPVMFPSESIEIGKYVRKIGGRMSMAHNGSSPSFASRVAPYLEAAAIDLKATKEGMSTIIGFTEGRGQVMFDRSIDTQNVLAAANVLVDVRTPVFGWTTLDDLLQIAESIVRQPHPEMKFWTLRLYKRVSWCDFEPPIQENVIWMANEVKHKFPVLPMGIRAKWEPRGFLFL
ncbi:MAG: hypothetical protein V1846_01355 [Candidatus Komeilibacteria bacterium]